MEVKEGKRTTVVIVEGFFILLTKVDRAPSDNVLNGYDVSGGESSDFGSMIVSKTITLPS